MSDKINFPKRKHHKLKDYDYSLPGYYYVTICVDKGKSVLSTVGQGLAPAEFVLRLTDIGTIAEEQLFELEKRITLISGDALDIELDTKFDLIFIDAANWNLLQLYTQ